MNIKKEIFLNIGAYLTSNMQIFDAVKYPNGILTTDMDLPGIAWFDKQMGQFTNSEQFYSIPLPGTLMEYGPFTWSTVGKNQQRGNGIIRFYHYFENYADSFTGSVNEQMALRFFEWTDQIHLLLQGYAIAGKMQALDRVGDNEDNAQDMIITSVVEYNTVIIDNSTDRTRKNVLVDPGMSVTRLKKTNRPAGDTFTDGFQL